MVMQLPDQRRNTGNLPLWTNDIYSEINEDICSPNPLPLRLTPDSFVAAECTLTPNCPDTPLKPYGFVVGHHPEG